MLPSHPPPPVVAGESDRDCGDGLGGAISSRLEGLHKPAHCHDRSLRARAREFREVREREMRERVVRGREMRERWGREMRER